MTTVSFDNTHASLSPSEFNATLTPAQQQAELSSIPTGQYGLGNKATTTTSVIATPTALDEWTFNPTSLLAVAPSNTVAGPPTGVLYANGNTNPAVPGRWIQTGSAVDA